MEKLISNEEIESRRANTKKAHLTPINQPISTAAREIESELQNLS
jgi:hypothetical protein